MNIDLNWINQNSNLLQLITNFVLVAITIVYVIYTKRIVDSTKQQIKLSQNPVLGIKIKKMEIETNHGRNHFCITLDIVNLGDAPATEILIDSEIELKYGEFHGEKQIPSYYSPYMIPYLRINEELTTELGTSQHYLGSSVRSIISDFKKCSDLNLERLKNNPSQESFKSSTLRIFVYYKNNLNQNFMSIYETILDIWSDADLLTLLEIDAAMDSSPNVEKNIVINEHPYISQSFSTKIIDEKIPRTEISARHKKQQ